MMHPAPDRNDRSARTDRPRFRQDLVAEPIEEQGGRFIDVMDPDSGNLFRFYEVEYSLACAMDGERDVPGIVKWAQDELGLSASPQEVRTVIATLGQLGFIDAGEAGEAVAPAAAAGVAPTVAAVSGAAPPEAVPGLAAGVVTGAPRVYPPSDLELGAAGGSAPARREPSPQAPSLTLGASGGAPARRSSEPVEAVALGAPGRGPARATPSPPISAPAGSSSDVSLDLSDHIAVRRDDVKEAVRASKVMSAVDVPQDLLDALEDKPSAKPAPELLGRPADLMRPPEARPQVRPDVRDAHDRGARPEPRVDARAEARPEPRVEARPDAEVRVGKAPLTRQPSATKPPVELPQVPALVDKPIQPAAPRSGVSPVLIVLLVLAVFGGAAFFVWRYVLDQQPADVDTSAQPVAPPVQPVPAPPPPPPPAPTAKIAMEVPAPDDIKLAGAGIIETILADKAVVKDGDVIVKLVGDKPIEAELTSLLRDQKRLHDQADAASTRRAAAQAAGNKAAEAAATTELADREKTLAAKDAQLSAKAAEIKKFLIYAPANGTFMPVAKTGQKLAAAAVVARLQRDATPVATFHVADPKLFSVGASVVLAVGKGEQRVACTVAEVQADSVKVTCPADPSLTEAADVTLTVPEPLAPPPAPTEPAGGSGAAPADPAGGSAAAPIEAPADPAGAPAGGPASGSAAAPDPAAAPVK